MTLLTIGIIGGLAAARDAIIDELGDVAQAMLAVDQSYTIDFPLSVAVHELTLISSSSDSQFRRRVFHQGRPAFRPPPPK